MIRKMTRKDIEMLLTRKGFFIGSLAAMAAWTVLSSNAASPGGSRSRATAAVRTVKIEDGELWWGAANFFGTNMPFSAKTRLAVNLDFECQVG